MDIKAYVVKGAGRVGRMNSEREQWTCFENPELGKLLAIPEGHTPEDLAIEFFGELTFVDMDTHGWDSPPTAGELAAWLADIRPQADISWMTHGAGLRLVFVGPYHRPRAIAAAMAAMKSFKIEIKTESRHPLSTRRGAVCGGMTWNNTEPDTSYVFKLDGDFTEHDRELALEKLDFEDGKRYDHSRCPLDTSKTSEAPEAVHVYKNSIYCFRCAGIGHSYNSQFPPGVFPLSAVIGGTATNLDRLVENWVHWPHARLELADQYKNLSEKVLHEAYRLGLEAKYGWDDPRIVSVFKDASDFVWGRGIWLSSNRFESRTVDGDAADSVPYCQIVVTNKDGEQEIKTDKAKKSQFRNSTPRGYTPVMPYRGLNLKVSDGSFIPVPVQCSKYKIDLLRQPIELDQCFSALNKYFPGVNRIYMMGAIAAGVCSARGAGKKPQICVDGPTGAGKGETVRLAASFLGDEAAKVRLTGDEEDLCRYFGTSLASGHRFFVIDEFSKVQQLHRKLGILLQFGSKLTWRPLYGECRTDDFDASIFYTSINFPDWVRASAEFCRRVRRVHLTLQVPDWNKTVGCDTSSWREQSPENARIANSILTHVYRVCFKNEFNFDAVADALGLGNLNDGADIVDPALYKELYRYCRGELGAVTFIQDQTFSRGWVDLSTGKAAEIVNLIIDRENFDDHKKARYICKNNLEAQPWCNILGFVNPDDTPVSLRVKIHGQKWGCRFESPGQRGQEKINEQLPGAKI